MSFKILDCTLRDGGYYTDWDFPDDIVNLYIEAVNALPIEYIEIGYRNLAHPSYMGRFAYTPVSILNTIREHCTKKISLMINEKEVKPEDLETLLNPIVGKVDMIRLAVDPKNFKRAIVLASHIKDKGFKVGFNVMYMSKWEEDPSFLDAIRDVNQVADLFCMVDSFGGIMPNEVKKIYSIIKKDVSINIGFHGHDNLEMSLANSIAAIEEGVDFIDSTILGMGRGAGNLKTELLLTYMSKQGWEVDFNILGEIVSAFSYLKDKYKWGTNLPYMLSGAYSIPQKDVMGWISNPAYSFNSIVSALDKKRNKSEETLSFPIFKGYHKECLIIGGGHSVEDHLSAILEYVKTKPELALIFATARHAGYFKDCSNSKYYCLTGDESKRLSKNLNGGQDFKGVCIIAPSPRLMSPDVPAFALKNTYELESLRFGSNYSDSCTAIAIETALSFGAEKVSVVGYDGYKGEILSEKEMTLTTENRNLFRTFNSISSKPLVTLTPSLYPDLTVKSIYSII
ncbi:MAG: aldolase catalytic domain-containing protein [Muribaculaceae bacterium]|nr:aldolase catalytic domain-containing protein [Muribaculaceae bacterium]